MRFKPYWFEVAALARILRAFCFQFSFTQAVLWRAPARRRDHQMTRLSPLTGGGCSRTQHRKMHRSQSENRAQKRQTKTHKRTSKTSSAKDCIGSAREGATDVWGDMTGLACCLRKEGETEHHPRSKENKSLRRRELSPGLPRDRRKY